MHYAMSEENFRGSGYTRDEFEDIMNSVSPEAFPPDSDDPDIFRQRSDEEWEW